MAKAPNQEISTAIGRAVGRQISAKEMGFTKPILQKLCIGEQDVEHFLYRVVGSAYALKPYKSRQKNDDGELMTGFGLIGNFKATKPGGEPKNGSVLYLPGYVQDMAVGALSNTDTAEIKIAFDVYARYDEESATSYVFTARDLLNATPTGIAEIEEELKALPMPSATLAFPSA